MNKGVPDCIPRVMENLSKPGRHCAICEIRDGIPTTKGWGYYAFRNGVRLLVVERGLDQRIRINGTIEIIVLEAGNEKVRLGIEGAPRFDTYAGG
jgi:hypothetical protein